MTNQKLKIGMFVAMFAIPIGLFIFLKVFGKNEYRLKILNPISSDCPRTSEDTMHRIPNFSFVSQEGKAITQQNFEGKIYVAEFFFTRCPDICKVMTSELSRVQDIFKDYPDVKILSHSVDPLADSVQVLKEYADFNKIDPNFWTLVTGDKQQIYQQAKCAYFIPVQTGTDGKIDFVHSDKLILIDKEKRIRGYYSGTSRDEVDRLITEIQVLLSEYKR
ncbi:MAG: SCO family protein [Bacteroidetes bacterium]|nr:MAG: SCO family protein [Bacteroidota bacterium]